jgi:two-component system response regulator PhoP
MLRPEHVLSRTELADRMYAEEDVDRDSNIIEVYVGRLRKKLDPDDTIKPIETVRGRGSRLALKPRKSSDTDPEPGATPGPASS